MFDFDKYYELSYLISRYNDIQTYLRLRIVGFLIRQSKNHKF